MDFRAGSAEVHLATRDQPLDRTRALRAAETTSRMVLVMDLGDHAEDLAWWRRLARTAARDGVHANAVRVGVTRGSLPPDVAADVLGHLTLRRYARQSDLDGALDQLLSPEPSYLVGQVIPCDGGLGLGRNAGPATESVVDGRRDGGTVLVIGASSGIGTAGALEVARRGNDVVLASRRTDDLEVVAEKIRGTGRRARVLRCDVTDEASVRSVVDRCADDVDALLYSAGHISYRPQGPVAVRPDYAVNLFGYVAACEQLAEHWVAAGKPGAIVGVSSLSAVSVAVPHTNDYVASKAAMAQFSRGLAASVGRHGIRVNTVCPGFVPTPITANTTPEFVTEWSRHTPLHRAGTPEEIATLLGYLLGSASEYVTGATIHADGGYGLGEVPSLWNGAI